jgi:hypothetical protein
MRHKKRRNYIESFTDNVQRFEILGQKIELVQKWNT